MKQILYKTHYSTFLEYGTHSFMGFFSFSYFFVNYDGCKKIWGVILFQLFQTKTSKLKEVKFNPKDQFSECSYYMVFLLLTSDQTTFSTGSSIYVEFFTVS